MNKLGRYCITLDDGRFYNTITHKFVLAQQLNEQFMLAGQEHAAIRQHLCSGVVRQVRLIPSFECNLRCPHCYVGHMLERPSGDPIGSSDPKLVADFLACLPGNNLAGCFVGGEPFLHPDFMRALMADKRLANFRWSVTTNGMFDFEQMADIIERLSNIAFSVDGLPPDHNRTRKSLQQVDDQFGVVYRNIRATVKRFPRLVKQLIVQGCHVGTTYDVEQRYQYFALMRLAGVLAANIRLGHEAPTINRPKATQFVNHVCRQTRTMPCCDYSNLTLLIYDNAIYNTYHQLAEAKPLGKLTDALDDIMGVRLQRVLTTMPMLHDDVCMNECRAVGICWGYCSNARHTFKDNKPSSICDRSWKETHLLEAVKDGRLAREVFDEHSCTSD